ncbi:MAG: glycosyltransferase [archaeon]
MQKFVSIIIPCREIDRYTQECIKHCLKLDYKNFEILVLTDSKSKNKFGKLVKIIETGKVKPSIKRNIAMKKSKAEIFAFIDSDAYPAKDWLKNAVKYLEEEKWGMVGGPNLTPKEDNFRQKMSGVLFSTWIVGGRTAIRYKIAKNQETVELPSCNFIVKSKDAAVFESDLLTAEDSKFCFSIIKKGKKILYANDVIVYHHRREVFKEHLKQVWTYGRDIAMLLRRESFSLDKSYYFLLSLFVLGVVIGGALSFFIQLIRQIYLACLSLYLLIIFISSIKKDVKEIPYLFIGIIITHFYYGIGFMQGLIIKPGKELNKR